MNGQAGVLTVKTELNGCGNLVDILPTGSTGADGLELKFTFWNPENRQSQLHHFAGESSQSLDFYVQILSTVQHQIPI